MEFFETETNTPTERLGKGDSAAKGNVLYS